MRFTNGILLLFAFSSCGAPGGEVVRGVFSYETRIVDLGEELGQYPSVAFDSKGRPSMSYYDGRDGSLKFAELVKTEWVITTVDKWISPDTGGVGAFSSLAIDQSGSPHISYMDRSRGQLKYAYLIGTEWKVKTLDQGPFVGSWTSLALDRNGAAHISYCYIRTDASNPANVAEAYPKYIMYDNRSAAIPEVIDPGLSGAYLLGDAKSFVLTTSLVLNSDNTPQVAYHDPVKRSLNIARRLTGGGWAITIIDSAQNKIVGQYNSLAIDSEGKLHVSYTESYPSILKYAAWDGTVWRIETVDAVKGEQKGLGNTMTLGPDSSPIISYIDSTWNDLKIAFFRNGRWQVFRLDSGGLDGVHPSIARFPLGITGVVYNQRSDGSNPPRSTLKLSLVEY